MDGGNSKKKGQPSTTEGQSDDPVGVAAEMVDMPSASADPYDSATAMPSPPSSGPSASVPSTSFFKPMPMPTHPLSAFVVATQSSTPAPHIPPTVEDTLKKILENQTTIMNTLVEHGSVIDELEKQIAAAGNIPFDLLIRSDPPAPTAPSVPVAPAGQSEKPDLAANTAEAVRQMFTNPVTPRDDDDVIQLEETEGGDASMDTAMSKAT
uniref:Neural cell adhesion molecule 1-like n=1 Tax=Nicotiana tabacum TaxID=4097 RepID=A0A1S3YQV6_TOBAC|nr:PREDICTED: neural cell adhesion molecule 1-like [Nicotiana tabacum]